MEWCCHRTSPSPFSIHATTRTTYTHDDYTTQHNTHNDTHDDDSHLEFTKQDNTQPPSFFFPDTRACEHARIRNPSTSHRRSPNTFRPTGSPRGPSPYTEQQNSFCSTPPTNPDTPRVGEERESHATPDPGRDAKDQTTGVEIFGVTRRARFVSDDRLRVGSLTSRSSRARSGTYF